MRRQFVVTLIAVLVMSQTLAAFAQSGRRSAPAGKEKPNAGAERQPPAAAGSPAPTPEEAPPAADDEEPVRVETNLVTVPVIASDRGGRYVPDLKAEDFSVFEDGAEQKVAFFAAVTAPFHVVLMLDTSASSTVEKLSQVQAAAVEFVRQLHADDRVKVVSFDDDVRDLCDFTGDAERLAAAIRSTRPGKGTRLYDAFDHAFRALGRVKGRKAVVMFTDGVDFHSERRTYEHNRRAVEESDVLVYPVRFDTREETERLARAQARGAQTVDLGTILGPAGVPGLPGTTIVVNPRGTPDPRDRPPTDRPYPDATTRRPDDTHRGARVPGPASGPQVSDDSIASMLDRLYRTADDYLEEMARSSGGTLVRADTLAQLPRAFRQIAEELRTQYSLGYYPANTARDGKFRKIRVRAARPNVAVRARPGYRARR
ncbi:MAG TPA: VWA domain-containing protein [Pyrinomonadaceae bacterium]|nr:VWA domain-containing protein [Pyrinomonadaceae bacterium]